MPDRSREMCVHKYIPGNLYGFAADAQGQVFFHLGAFNPGLAPATDMPTRCKTCPANRSCFWGKNPPPPVLGESVTVILDAESNLAEGQAPRARSVVRTSPPVVVEGVVDAFDTNRGFGFIKGQDGITYHLHRSEMIDGRLPQPGHPVMFYAGVRQGKPRACHVKVCA